MPDDISASIRDLAVHAYADHLGDSLTLITPEEARILAIPRGSLTPAEYEQIQSHVVHTYQFLKQIPWTKELGRVPEIARSHHEKLNGGGYPGGFGIPHTNYFETTIGFDYHPKKWLQFRPEVRYDHADHNAFGHLENQKNQVSVAADVLLKF